VTVVPRYYDTHHRWTDVVDSDGEMLAEDNENVLVFRNNFIRKLRILI
jgi:hypothetical protein